MITIFTNYFVVLKEKSPASDFLLTQGASKMVGMKIFAARLNVLAGYFFAAIIADGSIGADTVNGYKNYDRKRYQKDNDAGHQGQYPGPH